MSLSVEEQRFIESRERRFLFLLILEEMSTDLFYDSDDERDSFDVERRQIEKFRRHLLFASSESSSDDEEGIIDGSKVPSSSKTRSRARKTFLDISILSSSSSVNSIEENDENPFEIISKSINVEKTKKRSKTLGIAKSRLVPENIDIYDQEETNSNDDRTFILRLKQRNRISFLFHD